MEPEAYARLKELFLAAEELPETEREPYLATACAGDPALLAEVRALLSCGDSSGFLASPPAVPHASSLAGQVVAHFRVVERLGAGGMGVVYRATDTRLARTVALKLLQPELTLSIAARQRLLREARAVAALDHPNICTILEVGETAEGQTFLAMACYDGEDLRERLRHGPLPPALALEIADQIAAGLEHAHGRAIVHRDLKPANVMITAEGRVKVLDFGLARLVDETRLTGTGSSFGTPAYMSPEQIASAAVDARSDVWSLGVILYEMLTGEAPFSGEGAPAVFYSILHSEPPPLEARVAALPRGLAAVVDRLLRKSPSDRYPDMTAVRYDLAHVGTRTAPKLSWRSRLARRLGATRRRTGRWTAAAAVVLAALAVGAVALRPPSPRATDGALAGGEAGQLYRKGRNLYDRSEFAAARDMLQRAVAADPDFALAHATLSQATSYLGFFNRMPVAEANAQAEAAAERAVRLDPGLAAGHVALAQARFFADVDFDGAEAGARRAIELDPGSFDAHYVYGVVSLNRGRLDRALRELSRARELNPASGQVYMMLARAHLFRRDYQQVLAQVNQAQELLFTPMGATLLTKAYWQLGRRQEAAETAARWGPEVGQLHAHLAADRRAEAAQLVEAWGTARRAGGSGPDFFVLAYGHALLGDREEALAWLQRDYAEPGGRLSFAQYYQHPEWDLVRSDPRFQALVRGVIGPRSR